MKAGRKLLISSVLLFAVSLFAVPSQTERDLKKIYAVWNPLAPDNYTAGFLESECLIHASPEEIRKVLLDELDRWDEFVPDILYSRIISKEKADLIISSNPKSFRGVLRLIGTDERLLKERLYQVRENRTVFYRLVHLDFPWPLGNRWILTREIDIFDRTRQVFHRRFDMIAGNLIRSEGDWHLQPSLENPGWTHVRYELTADGGIHVPHFFYRKGAPKKVRAMLKAIRNRVEAGRGMTP